MMTIELNPVTWDLDLDANHNIPVASDPYSQAQDIASAVRVFQGEAWYDTTVGIPYLSSVIGMANPNAYSDMVDSVALTIPGVTSSTTLITALKNRGLVGQVSFKDTLGSTYVISLGGNTFPQSGGSGAVSSGGSTPYFTITAIDGGIV